MRVGIAGLLHESNTFLPRPATYEDFASTSLTKGEDLIERWQDAQHELGGCTWRERHSNGNCPQMIAGDSR
jgi:microcystin degradation protein MlrC